MKTTSALFLFSFLFALLSAAAGAEERLIPLDEFYLSVPVTEANTRGLRVAVRVQRGVHEPQGDTSIQVKCPAPSSWDPALEPDEVAALAEALAAAEQGLDYRKEIRRKYFKIVSEVVTVDGRKCVRMERGTEVLFTPEEGARLKAALEQAAAAEAWYQMLLTARTLPAKTARAHPPKARDFFLISKLGGVRAEGLDYEVSLTHFGIDKARRYQVEHGVQFFRLGGSQSSTSGEWVKRMLEQVALALQAVGKKEAFAYVSPQDGEGDDFSVKANLETQKADVTFEPGSFYGKHSPVQASFSLVHLAEIREIAAQGPAREKWFAEHEAWFFEKE